MRKRHRLLEQKTLLEKKFSAKQGTKMAAVGSAEPDGSYPISSPKDVSNAVKDWFRAKQGPGGTPADKKHIIRRAKALGATDRLPDGWVMRRPSARVSSARESSGSPIQLTELELAEPTVAGDPDHHIMEVTLIRAGTSRNGNHYPAEVLREAVGLFEGVRAFADHAVEDGRPERSIRDLIGYYRGVHLDEAGRLRAQLHLVPGNDWLFALLKEAEGNPGLCGLSIDAQGDVDRRRGATQVNRLLRVDSVDIVTKPAAGGQVDRILQSDRTNTKDRSMGKSDKNRPEDPPTDATQAGPAATLAEQQKVSPQAGSPSGLEIAGRSQSRDLALVQLVEEMKRERDLVKAEATLAVKLAESGLPEPVQAKLRKQFGGRTFEIPQLEEAIKDEKDTLALLTQQGQVSGMGFEKIHVAMGMSDFDQLQAAMDKLFDIAESEAANQVPGFSGIREAFQVCTGVDVAQIGSADRPLRPHYQEALRNKVRAGRLSEAEAILREADVTTSTFSYLLGTSMNKRLLADYQAWPSEWQKFTTIVGIKDFKQQSRIRLGAFGSLSTVAEDAAYTTLTLSDVQATYTATKRGNLVQITRETIVNDDLYAIKQIPQKLAVAAAFTLAEFVYGLLAPNGANIYDARPLFDSVNHLNTGVLAANLGTANSGTALSSAALQTAVIAIRKQKNLASKPIGLKPRYLLVPPDLEFTAMTILKSAGLPGGSNNDINPMMGYAEPIISAQLPTIGATSTTIWMAVADPKVIDTVEVGFVGGQANPVLLIQDMPLYGLNFTQDTISYKVRHEYGGAVVDYRGFYLGNN